MRTANVNYLKFSQIAEIEIKAHEVSRNGRNCGTKRKGREIQEKRGIAHDGGSKMGIKGDEGRRNGR